MIGYWGQGIIAVCIAIGVLGLTLKKAISFALYFQPVLFSVAFSLLVYAHLSSDFSLVSVYLNSHSKEPWLYRFAGTWGHHEGSLLLWCAIQSFVGVLTSRMAKDHLVKIWFLALTTTVTLLMLLVSNPFAVMANVPSEGEDLNPLLQDPSLLIHPPILYAGFVTLSAVFVLAITSLIRQQLLPIKVFQFWTFVPWTFLTAGLALGSFWAYYELGWGGWWFWDPVENLALVPWLSATALIHVWSVVSKSGQLQRWALFLSILSFLLCLLGTFIVRSGLLISVHSFVAAEDRAVLIGCWAAVWSSIALLIYIQYQNTFKETQEGIEGRGRVLALNNLGLMFITLAVSVGTIYPMLAPLWGNSLSVGAPYFNHAVVPLMFPLIVLMTFAIWMPWRFARLAKLVPLIVTCIGVALIISGAYFGFYRQQKIIPGIALALSGSLLYSTFLSLLNNRLRLLPMHLSHLAIGLLTVFAALSDVLETELQIIISVGKSFDFAGYQLKLEKIEKGQKDNFDFQRASISVENGAKQLGKLSPEWRWFEASKTHHRESSWLTHHLGHLYVALAEPYYDEHKQEYWGIHVFYRPYIWGIWMAMAMAVIAGLLGSIHYWQGICQIPQRPSRAAKVP